MPAFSVASLVVCLLLAQGPQRVLREHDIRFLTEPVPQLPAAHWPSPGPLHLEAWYVECHEERGIGALSTGGALDASGGDVPPGLGLSPEGIVALIRQNIAEDSWANERNSIDGKEGKLVVVQTPEVQEAIRRLLEATGSRRALLTVVEIAHVPVEALGPFADAPEPWIDSKEFDAAIERAGGGATRLSLTAYNEGRVGGFAGRWISQVADHEVNSTGIVPVINPVVERIPLGLTAEVRPVAIAGTDLHKLELRVLLLKEAGPAAKREWFFGELNLPPMADDSIDTTLILPAGKAGLAGFFRTGFIRSPEGVDRRGFAVLARVRPQAVRFEAPPERLEGDFRRRIYDAAFLLEPFPGEVGALDSAPLEALVRASDPEAWRDDRAALTFEDGRFVHATARASTHEKVQAALDGLVRERAAAGILEVRSFEGPLAEILAARASAEGGFLLPEAWKPDGKLTESLRGVLVGALGGRMEARSSLTRRFVGNVECVSGGTGFTVLSMPDPVLGSTGDGFLLEGSVQGPRPSGLLALDVKLDEVRTRLDSTAELFLAAAIGPAGRLPPKRGDDEKYVPSRRRLPAIRWLPFTVDLPSQDYRPCRSLAAVPQGRTVILKADSTAGGQGRMVVAVLRTSNGLEGRR